MLSSSAFAARKVAPTHYSMECGPLSNSSLDMPFRGKFSACSGRLRDFMAPIGSTPPVSLYLCLMNTRSLVEDDSVRLSLFVYLELLASRQFLYWLVSNTKFILNGPALWTNLLLTFNSFYNFSSLAVQMFNRICRY